MSTNNNLAIEQFNNSSSIKKEETYTGIPSSKILLWIGMAGMVMLFAGLTSAYVVRKAEGNWVEFTLPRMFTVSTIIIILSSFTFQYAMSAIKKNQFANVKVATLATLGLGLAFIFTQFYAWTVLVSNGIFMVGNPSGSFLYVLTGLHLAHLVGGILALIVVSVKTILEKYNSEDYVGMQVFAIYWHFLSVLWVYLFLFVAYIA